jgi:hypothetical protein
MGRFWSNFFIGPAGGPPGHILPHSAPRFLFYGPLLPSGNIKLTMGTLTFFHGKCLLLVLRFFIALNYVVGNMFEDEAQGESQDF